MTPGVSKKKAEKRKLEQPNCSNDNDETEPAICQPAICRRRSDNQGVCIQSPNKCIFCGKPEDKKHPNRPLSKLYRIEQRKPWNQFRLCTPYLKDENTRGRILTFIRECNDPFAKDIRYHHKCWNDNVRKSYGNAESIHFQNVNKALFFQHFFWIARRP